MRHLDPDAPQGRSMTTTDGATVEAMRTTVVIEVEWCANCGDHALAHWEDRENENADWVEQRPGCPGWALGYTTRSDRPGERIAAP